MRLDSVQTLLVSLPSIARRCLAFGFWRTRLRLCSFPRETALELELLGRLLEVIVQLLPQEARALGAAMSIEDTKVEDLGISAGTHVRRDFVVVRALSLSA